MRVCLAIWILCWKWKKLKKWISLPLLIGKHNENFIDDFHTLSAQFSCTINHINNLLRIFLITSTISLLFFTCIISHHQSFSKSLYNINNHPSNLLCLFQLFSYNQTLKFGSVRVKLSDESQTPNFQLPTITNPSNHYLLKVEEWKNKYHFHRSFS